MIGARPQGQDDFAVATALVGVDGDVVKDLGEGGDELSIEGALQVKTGDVTSFDFAIVGAD